jgi:HPt (histidine-containing phosphotransfer) domain-containing protein
MLFALCLFTRNLEPTIPFNDMKNEHKTDNHGIDKKSLTRDGTANDLSPSHTVFDWDGLLYRLMGDEELAEEIVDDFINQIHMNLDTLKQSLDKKDEILVKKEAHIINGASGNVGAVVLQEIAEKIEMAGDSGDLVKAQSHFTEFITQLKVFKNELDRLFR